MNHKYSFSFSNSMNYSSPALQIQNSMGYTNPTIIYSEEHHSQPLPNTRMSNPGVGNDINNMGQSGENDIVASGGHFSLSRPRGRPRGSKNKAKENTIEMTSEMKSIVLEIPPGKDVIEWLKQFAHSTNIFMNVLGGSGMVTDASISLISSVHPTIFSERLCLLSLTGPVGKISPSEPSGSCTLNAIFARTNGDVIGGTLWRLVTFGTMHVTALISKIPDVLVVCHANIA
ncbi:AT-hook motif nuclear-localized protein 24-like [Apium graveolens]|uniref:AT-hook motif nuclear-localized protein 24-like n=1 Tax=Apium graveolens TaxID=4045 RepID=UPI003D79EDC3